MKVRIRINKDNAFIADTQLWNGGNKGIEFFECYAYDFCDAVFNNETDIEPMHHRNKYWIRTIQFELLYNDSDEETMRAENIAPYLCYIENCGEDRAFLTRHKAIDILEYEALKTANTVPVGEWGHDYWF